MKSIEEHIAKDKEILINLKINPPQLGHKKKKFNN